MKNMKKIVKKQNPSSSLEYLFTLVNISLLDIPNHFLKYWLHRLKYVYTR